MLNADMNYPYPVIRTYAEDYKTTIFTGALKVNLQPDGYLIRPEFKIDNRGILDYIDNGKFTYAVEVLSPATWYRKLFAVKENHTIRLDPAFIHQRVELIPCIVAAEPIIGFINDDFEDEYRGISFDLKAGDVIAIGEARCFDALYQDDIIKNGSSIVKIVGDEKAKEMDYDFSETIITIKLPANQYKDYMECGCLKSKYKTLNAILTVPVLVEAIGIIAADEDDPEHTSGFEGKAWYNTIVVNMKRAAENNETKYRQMLKKPFASAEMLLENNYISALQYVHQTE